MSPCGAFTALLAVLAGLQSGEAVTCPADRQVPLHDEARLHQDLLCNYRADYRPVKDHKNPVTVRVRFSVKYINFDSLEESFTVHSWVALSWKDEFLTWTPSNYGDIKEIQLESHEIWTPGMALFNADESQYPSDSFYTTCLVTSEGRVACVPHLSHSGICRTSLQRWPYDSQNCSMYFGSWMHTGEQINFTFYDTDPVDLTDFQNGPGWRLTQVTNIRYKGQYSCCPNSSYPMLKYTFVLKRKMSGMTAIVVVPSVILVLLTLSSMFLDIKNNTRLVMEGFSLLGHFTFVTEIGYNVPKQSEEPPAILLFVRDSMIMTFFIIMMTLILIWLRNRTGKDAPSWVVFVIQMVTTTAGRYVVFTDFDHDSIERKGLSEEPRPTAFSEDGAHSASTWIQFANLLNSFAFFVSLLVYSILILNYIPLY